MKSMKMVIFVLVALMLPISMVWGAPAVKESPTDTLKVAMSTLLYETFLPWNGGGMGGGIPVYD